MDREISCYEELSERQLADAARAPTKEARIAHLEMALRLAQLAAQARNRHQAAGPLEADHGNNVTFLFQNGTINFREGDAG